MVVLPYEMAKAIVEPIRGHTAFDLKEQADSETINRLNKALNRQDGEEKEDSSMKKKKLTFPKDAFTSPETPQTPETPSTSSTLKAAKTPRRTPQRAGTRAQIRLKLHKTGAFDTRSKNVFTMAGKEVPGTDIDKILDHAYGANKSRHPKGSTEIAERLKLMDVQSLPNTAFQELVTGLPSSSSEPASKRRRWTKF